MPAKKQNPIKLRDFIGVNPTQIAKLVAIGAKTTGQMLSAGQRAESRAELAK